MLEEDGLIVYYLWLLDELLLELGFWGHCHLDLVLDGWLLLGFLLAGEEDIIDCRSVVAVVEF